MPFLSVPTPVKPHSNYRADYFNEMFYHPKADIVLRCRDGRTREQGGATLYILRRSVLSAASGFFEDLFDLPQPKEAEGVLWEGGASVGVLPLVEMEELSEHMDTVLRLTHRTHLKVSPFDDLQECTPIESLKILDIADKFEMQGVTALVASSGMGFALRDHCIFSLLGVTIIHRQYDLVRRAIDE